MSFFLWTQQDTETQCYICKSTISYGSHGYKLGGEIVCNHCIDGWSKSPQKEEALNGYKKAMKEYSLSIPSREGVKAS